MIGFALAAAMCSSPGTPSADDVAQLIPAEAYPRGFQMVAGEEEVTPIGYAPVAATYNLHGTLYAEAAGHPSQPMEERWAWVVKGWAKCRVEASPNLEIGCAQVAMTYNSPATRLAVDVARLRQEKAAWQQEVAYWEEEEEEEMESVSKADPKEVAAKCRT